MSNFTEKTRLFSRKTGEPFAGHFFNKAEGNQLITDVFGGNIQIAKDELFTLLNNIVSFLGKFYPDSNTLTPGKTDEIKLFKKFEHHTSEQLKCAATLLNQYGPKTYQYITLCSPGEKVNIELFLNNLVKENQMLRTGLLIATQCAKNMLKKKTGNNSKQAIQSLIYNLIPIYEKATGKSADRNFHQDRSTGSLRYKGQFFDFVHYVLSVINDKFTTLYPDKKEGNPYKICLEDSSVALGKHIHRILSNIKKATAEIG